MNNKKTYDFTAEESVSGEAAAGTDSSVDGWEAYERWLEMVRNDLDSGDQDEH